MKKFVLLLASLLILTSCASETPRVERSAPTGCEIDGVIAAFDTHVSGARYIPTEWQPGPGTDLAATYDAGGIACTYGIEEAEVGGTILWAPASDRLWAERSAIWQEDGQTPIDLSGFDEEAAYVLQDGTSADEMHLWSINILIDGIWIQIGATFLQTIEEANGIIDAAIAATES